MVAPFAQQVQNGHFLNQTIWNYYFETGTDKLTPAGMEKLDSLARVRPGPDPRLYVQTARDLLVTADNPDKIVAAAHRPGREAGGGHPEVPGTHPTSGGPVAYEVYVHDPPTPGIIAEAPAGAYRGSLARLPRRHQRRRRASAALGTGGGGNLTVAPVVGDGGPAARPAAVRRRRGRRRRP